MFCLHMANKAFQQLATSVTCRCLKNRHSELQMSLKDCCAELSCAVRGDVKR